MIGFENAATGCWACPVRCGFTRRRPVSAGGWGFGRPLGAV